MTSTEYETHVYVYDSGRSGPTTMVTGGVHGNEPSGYRAADEIASWEVDRGRLVVIPRANVPAIEANSRYNDNGDLNRQFPPRSGEPRTPLARAIWNEVERHDPDWMFDLHSARGIYKSGDGSVGQAMFPTWTSPARRYGENAVADLNDEFGFTGDMNYLMGNTLDADRDMLVHRVAGVLDRPGYICETTRKGTTTTEQVRWHLYTVEHVMNQYGQRRVSGLSADSEARTLTIGDSWKTYSLQNSYSNPVVLTKPQSYEGYHPSHIRLRNVSDDDFQARVEEWEYLDGEHYTERTGSLAVEAGTGQTESGVRYEAGTVSTDEAWKRVSFDQTFGRTPVVIAQSQSYTGSDPIVVRIQDASEDGFKVCLQEEEANGNHYDERIGYVAIERGQGTWHGKRFEARLYSRTAVTSDWRTYEFSRSYSSPVFLAGLQSFNGSDTAGLRRDGLSQSSVRLMAEEEQSADDETTHVGEDVGFIVFEG